MEMGDRGAGAGRFFFLVEKTARLRFPALKGEPAHSMKLLKCKSLKTHKSTRVERAPDWESKGWI